VLTGAGACGAVLVLEDNIPIRPVGTCNVNELFEVNLEQAAAIEVLRGPGSVLYGSSAVHGIINVSRRPNQIPAFGAGRGRQRQLSPARLAAGTGTRAFGTVLTRLTTAAGAMLGSRKKLNACGCGLSRSALKLRSGFKSRPGGGRIHHRENAYRDPAIARSNPDPEIYRNASGCDSRAVRGASGNELRSCAQLANDFSHFLLGQPVEENGQDSGGKSDDAAARLRAALIEPRCGLHTAACCSTNRPYDRRPDGRMRSARRQHYD
jgi:hypothetical protein